MRDLFRAAELVSRETMAGTGATIWPHGEAAESGYSIGRSAVEVKCPRDPGEILRAALFIGKVIRMSGYESERLAIGSWLDDDGRIMVEPVDVFPADIGEDAAIEIGRARGQYSIYSLDEDREIVIPSV